MTGAEQTTEGEELTRKANPMVDLYCPKHLQNKLLYVLKGGAGFCSQCRLYVQAAGVPMPTPARTADKAQKPQKSRKKGKAKVR